MKRASGRRGEEGFTIVEVLVAGAILALITLCGLQLCKTVTVVTARAAGDGRDAGALDLEAARLRDDAAPAFAIFVPAAATAGDGTSREVDFYARTDAGADLLWRYVYDAAHQTLQRFDYDAAGHSGVRSATGGSIDAGAAYAALTGVTAFDVRTIAADALGDPAHNVYAGVAAIFARAPQSYRVGYSRPGFDVPDAAGGNTVIAVTLAAGGAARVIHLAAGAMPAGFTVTGLPRWHAVLYRVDQTHRFLFGFAGKSHVFINAEIDVTYDGWQTRVPWCNFNVFGAPDGLDPHDPHADYQPGEAVEQAESLLAHCRRQQPAPPLRGSPGNPPDADVAAQVVPPAPPPACWTNPGPAGRCWPPDAPADWTPPPPLPPDAPPADWCRSRSASPLCVPQASTAGAATAGQNG